MKDGLLGWALARLGRGAGKNKLETSESLADLTQRFGLDPLAREVLALAWAAEKSLEVAQAAREKAGPSARALTVEVVRDALGHPLDLVLSAGGALRRHALVTLDTAGPALATSELRLGVGVCARLDGAPLSLDGFAPGVRAAAAPLDNSWSERFPASAKVAELVKDRIVSIEALLATIDGCPRRDALAVAIGAAKRFGRGAVFIDGEVLAGLGGRWELLAALRREADLEGMVLLVHQVAALGEAWRALSAPPPAQPLRPSLIILTDSARVRDVTLIEGLRHQLLMLNGAPTPEKPVEVIAAKEDPYEVIRRQAQQDADRAMGVWRPDPTPRPAGPAPVAPVPAAAAPVAAAPPAPAPVVAPPPAPEPVAAAPAPEAPTAEEKPKKRRSRKAIEHFGPDAEEAAPAPPAPAPPAAPAPAPADAAPTPVDPESQLNPNAPYLPISDRPTPDELAMVARTSKNPKQRLELLTELKPLKLPSVVAAMRDNVKSADPAIRALAEEAMAGFFGPNWNRTRAVPKPVQPPVSEDKNPNRPW
jgi:hypothetical protein